MTPTTSQIMGIVNVTPDSFSDGGQFSEAEAAIAHGLRLMEEGAQILDIGGESTRPGADDVPIKEELARVTPVLQGLSQRCDGILSIDTRKPEVARVAVEHGASIWNDVSALSYAPNSLTVAAELPCRLVLMHAQGDPKTMQRAPAYRDVVSEVRDYLGARMAACLEAGVDRDRIILDPGIGFGKTVDHNLELLANLDAFASLGAPILVGASRKRFIAALDSDAPTSDRLGGSIAAAVAAAAADVEFIRVHDVAATRQALKVHQAIRAARRPGP